MRHPSETPKRFPPSETPPSETPQSVDLYPASWDEIERDPRGEPGKRGRVAKLAGGDACIRTLFEPIFTSTVVAQPSDFQSDVPCREPHEHKRELIL